LSPEELAAMYERALRWREAWRAELADRKNGVNGHSVLAPVKRKDKPAKFAAGIARAEFGRFYWKSDKVASRKAKSKPGRKPTR
jgi:hypothetical protein